MRAISISSGFTIVELVVVITISGIISSLLYGPLNDLYTANSNGLKSIIQLTDTRSAVRTIEKDISQSAKFDYQNLDASDSEGITWTWDGAPIGANPTTKASLITVRYATEKNSSGNRLLSFSNVNDAKGRSCSVTSTPTSLFDDVIFFVKNNSLYRRTLVNTTPNCTGNTREQKQSCTNPNISATPPCTANDAKIVDNVDSFTVDYYSSSNASAATKITPSSSTIPNAVTVIVGLTTKIGTGTNTTTASSSLLITRVNGNN